MQNGVILMLLEPKNNIWYVCELFYFKNLYSMMAQYIARTTIPRWEYRFPSAQRSQASSGSASTTVGDYVGIPSVVLFFILQLKYAHVHNYFDWHSFSVHFHNVLKTVLLLTLYKDEFFILLLYIAYCIYLQGSK